MPNPIVGVVMGSDSDWETLKHAVAVLSYSYWKRRFALDSAVVGKAIRLNQTPFTIIGVIPKDFAYQGPPPLSVPVGPMNWKYRDVRIGVNVIGRLKPGVTIEQAGAAINSPYRAILNEVEAPLQHFSPQTLERFKKKEVTLENGSRGQSNLHKDVEAVHPAPGARPPEEFLTFRRSITGGRG